MSKILRFYWVVMCLCVMSIPGFSQITVTAFEELDNNLDATTNYPKKDLNGKTCAIIKIFTTQKGFTFDAGQVGIVATEYKPAEIWIYVPGGTRHLKITHEQLGHISNADVEGRYWFPEGGVKSGHCYKMEFEHDQLEGWLLFNTTPLGADVYMSQDGADETYLGVTPLSRKMPYGMYSYRVKKNKYNDEVGLVEIKDASLNMSVTLKPVMDSIAIDTTAINKNVIQPNQDVRTPANELNPFNRDSSVIVNIEEKHKPDTFVVKVKKEPFVKFGLEANFGVASKNSYSKTGFGVGATVRIGRMSSLVNVTLGARYQSSSVSKTLSYDFLDYESYNTFKGSANYKNTMTDVVIPAVLNFNFNKIYVGVGYELGLSIGNKESYTPSATDGFDYDVYQAYSEYIGEDTTPVSFPASSLILQAGLLNRHYDVKLYCKLGGAMTIGAGIGYYF